MTSLDSISTPNSNQYFVYVIKAVSGPVKIGLTNDLERRLSTLQTAHYEELTLAYVIRCADLAHAQMLERALHLKYKGKHVRGEWYDVTSDQIAADMRFAAQIHEFIHGLELTPVNPIESRQIAEAGTRRIGELDGSVKQISDGAFEATCPHCQRVFSALTHRAAINGLVAHTKSCKQRQTNDTPLNGLMS